MTTSDETQSNYLINTYPVHLAFCAGHLSGPLELQRTHAMMFSRGSARGWVNGLLAKWGVRGLDAGWLQAFYNF